MDLTLALVAAAASLGAFHTIPAPDHSVPFAALARAERWSAPRTAAVTAACGLGHVTVSVALGLLGALFGLEMFHAFGRRLESVAGFLLIAFGLVYALWGWRRVVNARWHDHGHAHGHPHWHWDGLKAVPHRDHAVPHRDHAGPHRDHAALTGITPALHRDHAGFHRDHAAPDHVHGIRPKDA